MNSTVERSSRISDLTEMRISFPKAGELVKEVYSKYGAMIWL
jgi:hypothetical protein